MLDVIVADGVQAGEFLAAYPADASRAITSLCLGVAVWYVAQGELPEDEFLVRYQDIARSIVVAWQQSVDRREGEAQWGG